MAQSRRRHDVGERAVYTQDAPTSRPLDGSFYDENLVHGAAQLSDMESDVDDDEYSDVESVDSHAGDGHEHDDPSLQPESDAESLEDRIEERIEDRIEDRQESSFFDKPWSEMCEALQKWNSLGAQSRFAVLAADSHTDGILSRGDFDKLPKHVRIRDGSVDTKLHKPNKPRVSNLLSQITVAISDQPAHGCARLAGAGCRIIVLICHSELARTTHVWDHSKHSLEMKYHMYNYNRYRTAVVCPGRNGAAVLYNTAKADCAMLSTFCSVVSKSYAHLQYPALASLRVFELEAHTYRMGDSRIPSPLELCTTFFSYLQTVRQVTAVTARRYATVLLIAVRFLFSQVRASSVWLLCPSKVCTDVTDLSRPLVLTNQNAHGSMRKVASAQLQHILTQWTDPLRMLQNQFTTRLRAMQALEVVHPEWYNFFELQWARRRAALAYHELLVAVLGQVAYYDSSINPWTAESFPHYSDDEWERQSDKWKRENEWDCSLHSGKASIGEDGRFARAVVAFVRQRGCRDHQNRLQNLCLIRRGEEVQPWKSLPESGSSRLPLKFHLYTLFSAHYCLTYLTAVACMPPGRVSLLPRLTWGSELYKTPEGRYRIKLRAFENAVNVEADRLGNAARFKQTSRFAGNDYYVPDMLERLLKPLDPTRVQNGSLSDQAVRVLLRPTRGLRVRRAGPKVDMEQSVRDLSLVPKCFVFPKMYPQREKRDSIPDETTSHDALSWRRFSRAAQQPFTIHHRSMPPRELRGVVASWMFSALSGTSAGVDQHVDQVNEFAAEWHRQTRSRLNSEGVQIDAIMDHEQMKKQMAAACLHSQGTQWTTYNREKLPKAFLDPLSKSMEAFCKSFDGHIPSPVCECCGCHGPAVDPFGKLRDAAGKDEWAYFRWVHRACLCVEDCSNGAGEAVVLGLGQPKPTTAPRLDVPKAFVNDSYFPVEWTLRSAPAQFKGSRVCDLAVHGFPKATKRIHDACLSEICCLRGSHGRNADAITLARKWRAFGRLRFKGIAGDFRNRAAYNENEDNDNDKDEDKKEDGEERDEEREEEDHEEDHEEEREEEYEEEDHEEEREEEDNDNDEDGAEKEDDEEREEEDDGQRAEEHKEEGEEEHKEEDHEEQPREGHQSSDPEDSGRRQNGRGYINRDFMQDGQDAALDVDEDDAEHKEAGEAQSEVGDPWPVLQFFPNLEMGSSKLREKLLKEGFWRLLDIFCSNQAECHDLVLRTRLQVYGPAILISGREKFASETRATGVFDDSPDKLVWCEQAKWGGHLKCVGSMTLPQLAKINPRNPESPWPVFTYHMQQPNRPRAVLETLLELSPCVVPACVLGMHWVSDPGLNQRLLPDSGWYVAIQLRIRSGLKWLTHQSNHDCEQAHERRGEAMKKFTNHLSSGGCPMVYGHEHIPLKQHVLLPFSQALELMHKLPKKDEVDWTEVWCPLARTYTKSLALSEAERLRICKLLWKRLGNQNEDTSTTLVREGLCIDLAILKKRDETPLAAPASSQARLMRFSFYT
jgi:hypothetical protein